MVRSIRWLRVALTCLSLSAGINAVTCPALAQAPADGKAAGTGAREKAPAAGAQQPAKPDVASLFSQPGDEPPQPFIPLHPRSVEDRQQTEAMRLYSAARALEDQRSWAEAVALLEQAQKLDPDSVAIARRLSRIYVGALGRPDKALEYGKKVLAVEPGDTDTLSRLVDYFNRKNDPAGAEALLQEVLANPKLDPHAPGRLLAEFELGRLYSGRIPQIAKAAEAYAKVMAALDDKSANRLSPLDQARILGNEPAAAYLNFGMVFLAAQKNELAVQAFERGLVYDEENPQIPLLLAETLLKLNKAERALALVDRYIKRQPHSLEAYELMAKVLTLLKRDNEITPRLEEAARLDSKNVPLQYVLADRYRETGQIENADALYKKLLTSQPTPQTYRALAASLLKRKKAADLLKVICEAMTRPNGLEAVTPQLQAAAADDALAEAMLDAGLAQLSAKPPTLPRSAFNVLTFIANPDRGINKTKRLERLVKLQQLLLEQNPSPQVYREIADTLRRMEQYAEAAKTLEQMMARYPNEKSPRFLSVLSQFHRMAGHNDAALAAVQQAVQLDPNDGESLVQLANLLADSGKFDEAVEIYRKAIKNEPGNALYEVMFGGMLTKFGRNDEAIKLFQDMLKRYATNEEIVKLAHSNLSIIYVNQGDYAKGEAELEILLQRLPDDAGVNNDLGYLYAEQGKNLEKAESMIRKALQEDPENHAYLDSLGWVLFKRGKVKEALAPLQKAVDLQKAAEKRGSQADVTIREHLGDVYLQLQEVDKARSIWLEAEQVASKTVPPDKRLPEIRKKLSSLKTLGPMPKVSTNRTP